ncbi:TPA: hypothetical protein DF272_06670 [Candidatus Falkowbacteria bacterium]|nr:hypothetical protein [Candidatus Falkowbacteria bacterium]
MLKVRADQRTYSQYSVVELPPDDVPAHVLQRDSKIIETLSRQKLLLVWKRLVLAYCRQGHHEAGPDCALLPCSFFLPDDDVNSDKPDEQTKGLVAAEGLLAVLRKFLMEFGDCTIEGSGFDLDTDNPFYILAPFTGACVIKVTRQ